MNTPLSQMAEPRLRHHACRESAADGVPFGAPGAVLSHTDLGRVARGEAAATLHPEARARLAASRARFERCLSEDRLVYGVTTGFGPLANRRTAPSDIETLQRNLIYHLASGVGAPYPYAEARAVLAARLSSIAQGYSGASDDLVDLILSVLNAGLAPVMPEKGTVGASGDLTPLAHAALALMGEGAFLDARGDVHPAGPCLREHGFAPLSLASRDGLALVNGTSAMTGVAALALERFDQALLWAHLLSGVHAECLEGRDEAWHEAFALARGHPGQERAGALLRRIAEGGARWDRSRAADAVAGARQGSPDTHARAHQDPYTIRCVPQILGAIIDIAQPARAIVLRELNASTDNPIFTDEAPFALHGGNFYGQHVAFAADTLRMAATKLAILSERQIARLTDETLNLGLPAFLQGRSTGLNSGFMGAQVTASALLAEMRARSTPASIQSVPTNGNNQDVVSMGTIAARLLRDHMDDLAHLQAIQALALAQAVDLRREGDPERAFSPAAVQFHIAVRMHAERLEDDRPLSGDIAATARAMGSWPFPDMAGPEDLFSEH